MKWSAGWKGMAVLAAILMVGAPSMARADTDEGPAKYGHRLTEATRVFQELTSSGDHKVPEKLMRDAKCVVVIPGMIKGAMGFGARCREIAFQPASSMNPCPEFRKTVLPMPSGLMS